jgi:monoamine oxidase
MNTPKLDRRSFLKHAGAAASVALAVPSALRAQNRADVIVIGAGLSGLNTALMLQAEGLNVQVIEGRKRVGGRVMSMRNVPGNPEAGGTSFFPGYARLLDAAQRYGVETIDITPRVRYARQRELVLDSKVVARADWPGHARNPFPEPLKQLMPWQFFQAMTAGKNPLASTDAWVDPEHAAEDVSVHQWLTRQGASDAAIQLGFSTNIAHGFTAHDVSMLMLWFVAAFTQLQIEMAPEGVFGFVAKGGNQSIPEAMAGALKNEVHFGRQVMGVRSGNDGVEVHCGDGTVYRGDFAVCSLPFSVLRKLKLDPVFRGPQSQAVHTLQSQLINHVHMVAKRPFWEDDGLAPAMFTDGPAGMLMAERNSEDPADVTSLTAWVRGIDAARLDQLPAGEAARVVVKAIENIRPAAKGQLEVLGYKSWYLDPFAAGDWAYWQPGQITEFANAMTQPHGRVHFCGEHTAVSNRGMEGAMESGERAALEIFSRV